MNFERVLRTAYQNSLLCEGRVVNHVPSQSVNHVALDRMPPPTNSKQSSTIALHLRSRGPKDVRLPPKVRNAFAAGLAR